MSASERRRHDWITTPQCPPNRREEVVAEEVEGALGVGRAFHVEPHEAAELLARARGSGVMLATQSSSSMSRPIWVSLTETFTSAPLAAIRSSICRYCVARGARPPGLA